MQISRLDGRCSPFIKYIIFPLSPGRGSREGKFAHFSGVGGQVGRLASRPYIVPGSRQSSRTFSTPGRWAHSRAASPSGQGEGAGDEGPGVHPAPAQEAQGRGKGAAAAAHQAHLRHHHVGGVQGKPVDISAFQNHRAQGPDPAQGQLQAAGGAAGLHHHVVIAGGQVRFQEGRDAIGAGQGQVLRVVAGQV